MASTPSIEKPQKVEIALYVLYTYLASVVALSFLVLPGLIKDLGLFPDFSYMGAFYVIGFSAGFIVEIQKGRNWARITFVVLSYLVIALCLGLSIWSPSYSPFRYGPFSIPALLVAVACAYLIQPDASVWFRAMEKARRDNLRQVESAWQEKLRNIAEHARKDSVRGLEPQQPDRVQATSEPAELKAEAVAEPLFVIRYQGYKRVGAIVLGALVLIFFGSVVLRGDVPDSKGVILGLFCMGFMGFACIAGTYGLLLLALFDEIRIYQDRIIQTWRLKSIIEIRIAEASYEYTSARYNSFVVIYRQGTSSRWIARLRGINYNESFMAGKDVDKLHSVLAALTGRKPQDFNGFRAKFPNLVARDTQRNTSIAAK